MHKHTYIYRTNHIQLQHCTRHLKQAITINSLHSSALLNVSISVISSTLHRFLRTGIESLTFVLLMFLFNFNFIIIIIFL